jgi:AraC-like DNA-binding protein
MHNQLLAEVDRVDRPLLAIGTDYPDATLLDFHQHRRAQFLYGLHGLMEVQTDDGAWVIPPYSGVWIPAAKPHQVRMQGVSTRSLYIEPQAAPRASPVCEVLRVSPLFHQLLLASLDIPALYAPEGRDGVLAQLLLHELRLAQPLPLFAPLPRDARLAQLCLNFLASPQIHVSPQSWAAQLHLSLRSFTRKFRQQTGLCFTDWRQQACLLAALTQLTAGHSVTHVALTLGYDSPSAFATMFRKSLGLAPTAYLRQLDRAHDSPAQIQ